jgi:hypothetical protein
MNQTKSNKGVFAYYRVIITDYIPRRSLSYTYFNNMYSQLSSHRCAIPGI